MPNAAAPPACPRLTLGVQIGAVNERRERRPIDRRQRVEDEIDSGPAPLGILNANPAETNFAFGRPRSKLIVTCVGVSTIDEITPLAIRARVVELPCDGPPGTWPGGSTSSPPNRHDAPIISWMNASLGFALASASTAETASVISATAVSMTRFLISTSFGTQCPSRTYAEEAEPDGVSLQARERGRLTRRAAHVGATDGPQALAATRRKSTSLMVTPGAAQLLAGEADRRACSSVSNTTNEKP